METPCYGNQLLENENPPPFNGNLLSFVVTIFFRESGFPQIFSWCNWNEYFFQNIILKFGSRSAELYRIGSTRSDQIENFRYNLVWFKFPTKSTSFQFRSSEPDFIRNNSQKKTVLLKNERIIIRKANNLLVDVMSSGYEWF